MVDLERAAALGERAAYIEIAADMRRRVDIEGSGRRLRSDAHTATLRDRKARVEIRGQIQAVLIRVPELAVR